MCNSCDDLQARTPVWCIVQSSGVKSAQEHTPLTHWRDQAVEEEPWHNLDSVRLESLGSEWCNVERRDLGRSSKRRVDPSSRS